MQSPTPPNTSPTSPASSCRWKRGRPVSVYYSSTKSTTDTSAWRPQLPHDNKDTEVPISDALQHMRLWDSSKAIVFKPTASMDARHATPTVADPEPVRSLRAVKNVTPDRTAISDRTKRVEHGTANDPEVRRDSVAPDAEPVSFSEQEPIAQDDFSMQRSSDSDYIPSEDQESTIKDQLDEKEVNDMEEVEQEAEEHVDLTFKIPEDTLRAAMLASPNTRASFWSARMYRGPDGQTLTTHYCRSLEVAERVAQHFLKEKVLGFDIEWRPFSGVKNIKLNASLIQLASEDRVALFHISQFQGSTSGELMPPTLKIILESPDIYKVGVAVKGDFSRLRKYLNIEAQGIFELSRLHNLVEWHATDPNKLSKKLIGLSAQVLQHLQLPLYKGEQLQDDPEDTANVRRSDWSKPLDLQQIHYAASDAYAGFRLFHILEWKRKQLRPTPPIQGVCDDDAKPAPKSTAPKKKKRVAAKTTPVAGTGEQSAQAFEGDQEQESELDQDSEQVEEEGEYDTAPEDVMDSYELEDPVVQTSTSDGQAVAADKTSNETPRTRKCVGRVSLPWLTGPDPGYPILPKEREEDIRTFNLPVKTHPEVVATSDTHPLEPNVAEEEDEFEDPELDAVLQVMELDEEGNLQILAAPASEQNEQATEPTSSKDTPTDTEDTNTQSAYLPDSSDDADLSDYIPSSFDTDTDIKTPSLTADTDSPAPTLSSLNPHTPEYTAATQWSQTYLSSTIPSPSSALPPRIRATISHLRAYHLWHHQGMSLEEVAGHLREPPLALSTVAGYVLQAVSLERLDAEERRVRGVVEGLPVGMRGRWRGLEK